jgi:hypothetical protein
MASPHRLFRGFGGDPKKGGRKTAPPIPHGCASCDVCKMPRGTLWKKDGCPVWTLYPGYTQEDARMESEFEVAKEYEVIPAEDEGFYNPETKTLDYGKLSAVVGTPVAQHVDDGIVRRIFLPHEVWEKMSNFINLVDIEISGFGRVYSESGEEHWSEADLKETQATIAQGAAPRKWVTKYKNFYIEDVFILEQTNTGAFTSMEPAAISKFLVDVVRKGEKPENYNLWWHSHVNMGTFWSGTDDATAIRLSKGGELISIVGNKRGELRARWDCGGVTVDDIQVIIIQPKVSDIKAHCEAEIKEKVKEQKWVQKFGNWAGWGRESNLNDYDYGKGWETDNYDPCASYGHFFSSHEPHHCVSCNKSKEEVKKEMNGKPCTHKWSYDNKVCVLCGEDRANVKEDDLPKEEGGCTDGGTHEWSYDGSVCLYCGAPKEKQGEPKEENPYKDLDNKLRGD